MSSPHPSLLQDGTAWLLAIGQRLRAEYDALAEPMPPRLTALLKQLEMPTEEGVLQHGSFALSPDRQAASSRGDNAHRGLSAVEARAVI